MKQKGADMKNAIDLEAMDTAFPPSPTTPPEGLEIPPPSARVPPGTANLLLERVIGIYASRFAEVLEGRTCLQRRGITNAALLDRHRVGYADGKLAELLPKDGPLKDELKSLGILLDNGQERFLGCVVYPVYNQDGQLVTIMGHAAGDGPLQHRSLPGCPMGLWNVAALKLYPEIILAPSPLDGLSVMASGHANVTAFYGILELDDPRLALFKKHGVQKVILLAGDKEAANTSRLEQQLATEGIHVTARMLPEGHDPNSFLVEQGPAKLAAFLAVPDTPPPTTGHAPTRPAERVALTFGPRRYEIWDPDKGTRRLKATIRVEQGGKLHVDTLDFYSARSRRSLAQDLCRIFIETPETIEAEIDKLLRHCESLPLPQHRADSGGQPAAGPLSPEERSEAEAFGRRDILFEEIMSDFEACGLVGEKANKLLCYLAMTSRKLDEPLSVLILSSSGAGKTVLQDTALTFCPPEDLIKLTSLSAKDLSPRMRPAGMQLDVVAGLDETGIGGIGVALKLALELIKHAFKAGGCTAWMPLEENIATGPVVNPKVALATAASFLSAESDRCLVHLKVSAFSQIISDVPVDRLKPVRRLPDPVAHRLARKLDAELPHEHLLLAIERLVLDELLQQDVRHQSHAGEAAGNQAGHQFSHDRRALPIELAHELTADDQAAEILRRHHINLFGHFLADAFVGLRILPDFIGVDDHLFRGQVRRQAGDAGPAGATSGGRGRRNRLLDDDRLGGQVG
jgi:hypothetical protein